MQGQARLQLEPTLETVRAPHPRAPVAFYARISTVIASGHALRCCPLAGVEAETLRVGVTELMCRITSHTHCVAVKPLETADLTRVS